MPEDYHLRSPVHLVSPTQANNRENKATMLHTKIHGLENPSCTWTPGHVLAFRLLIVADDQFLLHQFRVDHYTFCNVCPDMPADESPGAVQIRAIIAGPHQWEDRDPRDFLGHPSGELWYALSRAIHRDARTYLVPPPPRRGVTSGGRSEASRRPGTTHNRRTHDPTSVDIACNFIHTAATFFQIQNFPWLSDISSSGDLDRLGLTFNHLTLADQWLAVLEARMATMQYVVDQNRFITVPIVCNDNLALYLGEAFKVWADYPHYHQEGVIVIAAANTYIRFMHFRFGRDYEEYIRTTDEPSQTSLIEDETKDTCVYMHASKWFDVRYPLGRKSTLCHILGLMRWHDRQRHERDQRQRRDNIPS